MYLRLYIAIMLIAVCSHVTPQPPAGYYDSASGLTGKTLQQALHNIIKNHTVLSYSSLYSYFEKTDIKADNSVWDMYSDKPGGTLSYVYNYKSGQECGNYDSEGDCYNREHSFPASWFNDASPMYSDLFHLYPTDGYVNNRRSNFPFGETNSPSWTSTNGSMVGPCSWTGYNGTVFEPIDEYKGDFARTCFYMAVRYYGEDASWPGSDMTTGSQPKEWALGMLLAWHRADAVSNKETNRNNEVYKYQNNRNPFIDDPLYAEKIWGSLNPVEETHLDEQQLILYPNPANKVLNINPNSYDCTGTEAFIYDFSGCLVKVAAIDEGTTLVDISGLHQGVHFMTIICADRRVKGIFIVN